MGVSTSWSAARITELNLDSGADDDDDEDVDVEPDILWLVLLKPVVIAEEIG